MYKTKKGLQFIRENKGLTQLELANKLNVDIAAIRSWELGAEFPTPKTMRKICAILDSSCESIIFNETRKPLDLSKLTSEQQETIIQVFNKIRNT